MADANRRSSFEGMSHPVTGNIRVIDTHVHVWEITSPWMAWIEGRPPSWNPVRRDVSWEDLCGVLDGSGVAELMLVQACTTPAETCRMLELASSQSRVRGVVGWADLRTLQSTEADLAAFAATGAGKLVGLRHNHRWAPVGHDGLLTGEIVPSCRLLAERRLTLDLFFPDFSELELAVGLADAVPEGVYVIDHLGRPVLDDPDAFAPWAEVMGRLAERPNVYVKYSGWATNMGRTVASDVKPCIDFVLERFGPERVMFASNWPVALVAGSYADTYRATLEAIADLPQSELEKLLRTTAERCYLSRRSGP